MAKTEVFVLIFTFSSFESYKCERLYSKDTKNIVSVKCHNLNLVFKKKKRDLLPIEIVHDMISLTIGLRLFRKRKKSITQIT